MRTVLFVFLFVVFFAFTVHHPPSHGRESHETTSAIAAKLIVGTKAVSVGLVLLPNQC